MENKKNNRIEIRLTEEEKKNFLVKAKKYTSMSALIIDAVKYFDDRGGANKIDSLNRWGEEFNSFNFKINKIGNNINQIAHYLNILKQQDIQVNHDILILIEEQLRDWNNLFGELTKLQTKYTENIIDI